MLMFFYPLTTEVIVNVTALLQPTINLRAVQANEWFSVLHAAQKIVRFAIFFSFKLFKQSGLLSSLLREV